MTQTKLDTYLQALAKPETRPAPPPRGAKPERREAILAVAHDVFLEAGYEGASMSQIAARLGGSKGTLYSYFDSKEALFQALIVHNCARSRDVLFDVTDDMGLEDTLLTIARAYIRLVNSNWATRMLQIISTETRRWPALGALFYESGPANAIARLSQQIEIHGADLAIDDSTAAAENFVTLCRGSLHLRRTLGLAPEPDAATIESEAQRAVRAFIKLYTP